MDDKGLKTTVFSNMIWKFAERMGAQLITVIVSIILARLLSPNDFGAIALITVFINISHVFVTHGLGNALIQKRDVDNIDFSSVFFFNLVFSILIYIAFFFAAPYIAEFYALPILSPTLRVLALRIPITSFDLVQQAYVARKLIFRKFFFSTLLGAIVSAAVGITMAYNGFGIWALVIQQISSSVICAATLWITVGWRPTFSFSFSRMAILYKYGWKILCSGLIDVVYQELTNLIIGKKHTAAELGYYNNGNKYVRIAITNVSDSIGSVLFPTIAKFQDDKERVKGIAKRAIKSASYIVFPLVFGAFILAAPLIELLMTAKWLPSTVFMQIACITFLFYPLNSANAETIKAVGDSGLFLKLEIIKKTFGTLILLAAIPFGVFPLALSVAVTACFSYIISALANKKLIGYSFFEQLRDLLPSAVLSFIMAGTAYGVGLLVSGQPLILRIVSQALAGACVYIGLSIIFKLDSFIYIKNTLLALINKKNPKTNELPHSNA